MLAVRVIVLFCHSNIFFYTNYASEVFYSFFSENWILLIYRDGKKYNSYCDMQNREAWVKVVCDKSGKVINFITPHPLLCASYLRSFAIKFYQE